MIPIKINEIQMADEWNVDVFPNLTNGNISISTEKNEVLNIKVTDLTGKIVYSGKINPDSTLDLSSLKSSIYFIEIQNNNNEIVRKKIVKE
jgi:hypothetical protein